METRLIKKSEDLAAAKDLFNAVTDWTEEIDRAVAGKEMPYLLIGSFSEDLEFGNIYRFIAVDHNDLGQKEASEQSGLSSEGSEERPVYVKYLVNLHLGIGYVNAEHKEQIEVELSEGLSPQEIDDELSEYAEDWAGNYIDLGYSYSRCEN